MRRALLCCLLLPLGACTGGSVTTDASICVQGAAPLALSAASGECQPLHIEHGICDVEASGYSADQYVWYDDGCLQRTAEMVPNTAADPNNAWGGYMRRYTYVTQGAVRDCIGTNGDAPGFGWLVNHFSGGVADSRWNKGDAYATVLAGRHHAIHQYTWTYPVDGYTMHATVQWLFATGRAHPLWAVTFDTSQAPQNAINADTRSPYGAFGWDGGAGADVDGVGWGDHNKFTTLGSPMALTNGWDYTAANAIPYVRTWTATTDAEMGSVQTQTYTQHDAGGFWFYASRGTQNPNGPMPDPTNWPYQIDQYELPYTASKKIAWGTNFGAVGQTAYDSYGGDRKLVGYPYQSYSVHVVLGTHTGNTVPGVVDDEESNQAATFSASNATVDTSGPAGIARTDVQTFSPSGYNPVYGTWDVHTLTGGGPVRLVLQAGITPLHRPMFVVHNWQGAVPNVSLDGQALTADKEFYASIDSVNKNLWITLASDVSSITAATLLLQ